ncbi:MAG: hypothetical protein PVH87_24860, partial [Desulfobacteraceae bacterium]|jgi:hypothetical protein
VQFIDRDGLRIYHCQKSDNVYRILIKNYNDIEAKIIKQEWWGLHEGTEVSYNGEKHSLKSNVLGIKVTLEIINRSSMKIVLDKPFYLLDEDSMLLQSFNMTKGKDSKEFVEDRISIKPNQTIVLNCSSGMGAMDEYKNSEEFYFSSRYWKLKLTPISEKEINFK